MTKAILYNRISTDPSKSMLLTPIKKGKVVGGEWFTPRELGFEIIEPNLKAIKQLKKQLIKGESK